MTTVVLILALFCFAVGAGVLAANPRRFTNQAFTIVSLLITLWLALVYQAVRVEVLRASGLSVSATTWFRLNASVLAFVPWAIWLVKESLITSTTSRSKILASSWRWFAFGICGLLLCHHENFVSLDVNGHFQRGTSYIAASILIFSANVILMTQVLGELNKRTGSQRIELQFLALNISIAGILCALFNALGNILQMVEIKRVTPFVYAATYTLTAWGLTTHRIFDVRQVSLSLAQRSGVFSILVFGSILSWKVSSQWVPSSYALGGSIAISGMLCLWLERSSRRWLRIDNEYALAILRREIIHQSTLKRDPDALLVSYQSVLRNHCLCQTAWLTTYSPDQHSGPDRITASHSGFAVLFELGWATPESLQRRRKTAALEDLHAYLQQHAIGLMLSIPQGSQTPSLIVSLGPKINEWPFTYPEIQRLQNAVELMDNILSQTRLAAQAALRAKTEHLAMMSRGLAHDLKNLLTPVSTFLIHTEGRFARESVEAEVHAAAQRSIRIMSDYVREAGFFAEKLAPRIETTALKTIFDGVRDATAARAKAREVELTFAVEGAPSLHADAVLIQRLVANLVTNALDACAPGKTVSVFGHGTAERVHIQVVDAGRGIAPENLSRIFEPYFTTKDFGEDVRGFGLGLTICQKIVALHGGTVTVSSTPGHGTTVRVELPAVAREAGDGVAVATRT